jgi:Grx4 family monothiol glutaredoxin
MPLLLAKTLAEVDSAISSTVGCVVHVGAPWCEPCTGVNAFLAQQNFPGVNIVYVDAEEVPAFAERESVDSVPHVSVYRPEGGSAKKIAEISGAKMAEIDTTLRSTFDPALDRSKFSSMDEYLRFLIRKDKIMLFITGTPSMPRCGFTGKLIELMNKHKVPYTFFDVWTDDEVCQALKVFSDWPTFPQVYVEGELVGGYDICAELEKQGKLTETLKV